MEYHSFLCIGLNNKKSYILVSVSLWSIIHSYPSLNALTQKQANDFVKLPSPYGVSFILIQYIVNIWTEKNVYKFPSPCGVSFILIIEAEIYVRDGVMFPSPYGISFILIRTLTNEYKADKTALCFCLLAEYHSFLSYSQKSLLLSYVFSVLS